MGQSDPTESTPGLAEKIASELWLPLELAYLSHARRLLITQRVLAAVESEYHLIPKNAREGFRVHTIGDYQDVS